MAHYFVPPNESSGLYGLTTEGGYSHAWKLTVNAGSSGTIGLWAGYDQGGDPLQITSNNPGIIDFDEPAMSLASGDRFIRIVGRRPGFTILDARDPNAVWCSLQVEVLGELYTPAIPDWRLEQMSWDYYKQVISSKMSDYDYCRRWKLRRDQFINLLSIFRRAGHGRDYWEEQEQLTAPAGQIVPTDDFLVIGEGGIVTLDSVYGPVVLGRRIQQIKPKTGIGSVAAGVARAFTSNRNVIGAIEATGDLIEIGASGFAVARMNQATIKPQIYPTKTIQQRKIVGDLFRDQVAAELRRIHQGTGYTVETEVSFTTDQGLRQGDVVLRAPNGKIVSVFECKTGKGDAIPKQMRKDTELYLEKDIRTIKVTNDFFFVPE
jgi:hypothetical protein